MKMILNGNTNKVINLSSYYRNASIDGDTHRVVIQLDLNFSDSYAGNAIDFLSGYLNKPITSIAIYNEADTQYLDLHDIEGMLQNVYENGNDESRNGNASLHIELIEAE